MEKCLKSLQEDSKQRSKVFISTFNTRTSDYIMQDVVPVNQKTVSSIIEDFHLSSTVHHMVYSYDRNKSRISKGRNYMLLKKPNFSVNSSVRYKADRSIPRGISSVTLANRLETYLFWDKDNSQKENQDVQRKNRRELQIQPRKLVRYYSCSEERHEEKELTCKYCLSDKHISNFCVSVQLNKNEQTSFGRSPETKSLEIVRCGCCGARGHIWCRLDFNELAAKRAFEIPFPSLEIMEIDQAQKRFLDAEVIEG